MALAAKQFNVKAILKSLAGYKHQVVAGSAGCGDGRLAPARTRTLPK